VNTPKLFPVTMVIVNHRTPDLLRQSADSLKRYYPSLPLHLVDNGSGDDSVRVMEEFAARFPDSTSLQFNRRNIHHGPAMDQALRRLESPYVLFFDSDSTMIRGGIVEVMLQQLEARSEHYIAGQQIYLDRRGFDVTMETPGAISYIRPICMLVKSELYLTLPPFERHGAPCLRNVVAAQERGLKLVQVPIDEFVQHRGRGTAGRHGYALGWRGKLNHLLHKLGV
jgi:glycosyltransferase involved in cell wall biosynthesis